MAEDFWNNVFSSSDYHYGTEPNEWIRHSFRRYVLPGSVPPGAAALCGTSGRISVTELAAGEGRNAVWLAEQGCRVTAVDLSETGLEKIRTLAGQRGVTVETVYRDALAPVASEACAGEVLPVAHVVISTFFHARPHRKEELFRAHQDLTATGGLVIAEWFHPDQRAGGFTSGGPHDVAMMISPEEVRRGFAGWEFIVNRRQERFLAEGRGHQGAAVVTQLVCRKP